MIEYSVPQVPAHLSPTSMPMAALPIGHGSPTRSRIASSPRRAGSTPSGQRLATRCTAYVLRGVRTVAAAAVGLTAICASATLWASPPEQAWTEDIHLHPSGPAELRMSYGLSLPEDDYSEPAYDVVTLRTLAGFDRAPVELSPSISLVNVEGFGTQLFNVGLRARYRLSGKTGNPKLALAMGYQLMLVGSHEHRIEQRLAGRVRPNQNLSLAWEIGLQEHFGNQTHVEGRVSASASYGVALNLVRLSLETFALVPLVGERITDFAVGDRRDTFAFYVGPGLRLNFEDYLWVSGSAVTGALVGDGAPMMVRVIVGTQF